MLLTAWRVTKDGFVPSNDMPFGLRTMISIKSKKWNFGPMNRTFKPELQQEAQLSQRYRTTLRVTKHFAKSLEVTQGHSKWHCCVCKSPLVFQWHYICMLYRFWDIQRRRMSWHGIQGHWRWRHLIDHIHYTTFYWSAIVSIAVSCTIFKLIDVE